jgi:hypothetical protein
MAHCLHSSASYDMLHLVSLTCTMKGMLALLWCSVFLSTLVLKHNHLPHPCVSVYPLPSCLQCVDWGDVGEGRQAAELMAEWAMIHTADALELLSPSFKSEEVCTRLLRAIRSSAFAVRACRLSR